MTEFFKETLKRLDNREHISINDKMNLAYELACHIGYSDGHMIVRASKEYEAISDNVWMFIDGLYHKWMEKMIDGRASIQQNIDFDLSAEEKVLEGYIEAFLPVYKAFNPST